MMKINHGVSGTALGADNAARVRAYLENLAAAGHRLPERDGRPNMSAIALAAGVDRQVLYKNPAAKAALEAAASSLGLGAYDQRSDPEPRDRRDQRIHKLEQENATLRAEVIDLRRKLRRLEHIEDMIVDTGRRIVR